MLQWMSRVMITLVVVLTIGLGGVLGQDRLADQLIVFLVADTGADIGKFCEKDRDVLTKVLSEAFESPESPFQNRYKVILLQGDDVAPESVLAKIKETPVSPEDAVLFYYTGHGGSDNEKGHFLATSQGRLLRTKLRAALLEKQARMLAIITDSCSNEAEFEPPDRQTPAKWRVIHDLFFVQTGVVDIQSSQEGVLSWCRTFTNAMAANFCVPVKSLDSNGDGFVEWSEYFTALHRDTLVNFHLIRKRNDSDHKVQKATPQEPYAFNLPSKPVVPASTMTIPANGSSPVTFTTISAPSEGPLVLTGDSLGKLRLWDSVNGKQIRVFEQPSQFVWSASISSDGRHALSNDLFHNHGEELKTENPTRIWDVATGKQLKRIPSAQHGVGVSLLEKDRAVLADTTTGKWTLWNWKDNTVAGAFEPKRRHHLNLAELNGGQFLRLVDNDPASGRCWVQTINAQTDQESFLEFPMALRPFLTAVSPDGRYLALALSPDVDSKGDLSAGRNLWNIEIWRCDGAKLERVKTFLHHRGDAPCLGFSQNNRYFALTFREYILDSAESKWSTYPLHCQFQVWDLEANKQKLLINDLPPQSGYSRYPRGVAFVNKGLGVALAYGNEVRVYPLEEGK